MLDYIGVSWEPEVLKFNELERTVKTASVWQVRQPIYKTSKAKWKRYELYLGTLLQGTNATIQPEPIEGLITLLKAGFLTDGVALYKDGKLDNAEMSFKKSCIITLNMPPVIIFLVWYISVKIIPKTALLS
jgi:hypothetical protein